MKIFDIVWHKWFGRPYTLAASQTGHGRKTVVLLHGIGRDGEVWQPLIEQLDKRKWRIVTPDLLGFGRSPKPQWKTYSVQDHAVAVVATLKKLRIHGPVILVGHSMGCLVATHIAAHWPGFASRLILYEPPLYADDLTFRTHMRWRRYYFALYEFIAAHPQLAFAQSRLFWSMAKRIVGLRLRQEEWIPFQRSLRNTIMRQTAYRELHHIKVPTDIIHGRFDLIVTRADLRRMYRDNKNITWHTTSDVHNISVRAAKYIARQLGEKPNTREGNHKNT